MYDLEGKVALVTGAGAPRGIGRAIALRLAAEGADLVVNDLPGATRSPVDDVVAEVEAAGSRAISAPADVSDASQVDDMVARALDTFGRIHILVNNAASRPGRDRVPVIELEEEAWDLVQRVNSKGTFLCSRAVARHMVGRGGGGKIVNISSRRGLQGAALYAAYSSSKFAIIGFTQSLALELAPHKINVNAVCPGMVDTDRIADIAGAMRPPGESVEEHRSRMLEERAAQIPIGRVAEGEDIAGVVAFLSSSESDYITGLAVNLSGGLQL